MWAVSVESARLAPQQQMSAAGTLEYNDVCCCKRQKKIHKTLRKAGRTVNMKQSDCQMLKQMRPDRSFWWYWGSKESEPRCCWTSPYFCTPTIGFLMINNDGGRRIEDKDREGLCPATDPRGDVDPIDKTFAYNQVINHLTSDIRDALILKVVGMAVGVAAVHGGPAAQHAQAYKSAGTLKRAAEGALGKAFDGAVRHRFVSASNPPIMAPTEWFRYGGDRPLEVAKSVHVFNHGKEFPNVRDWFHNEIREDGHAIVVFQDPSTYVPPARGTLALVNTSAREFCGQDSQQFATVCLKMNATGDVLSVKVDVDLKKELNVTSEVEGA